MENNIYEEIKKIYDDKRKNINDKLIIKKQKLNKQFPEIEQKEKEITNIALDSTKKIIFASEEEKKVIENNMEKEIKKIRKQINDILKENNVPKNYLEPEYECKICKDTGVVEENNTTKECSCYKQLLINESFKAANLKKIDTENFSSFDPLVYSDEVDKDKYGTNLSPRSNIERIKTCIMDFVENFDNVKENGILFSGKPGLGKTFMSNCIAKEILQKGYTVLYQTAPMLLDTVIKYKFTNYKNSNVDVEKLYKNIFLVDLLIIDDAGTENMNTQRHEEWFEIINQRMLNQKKTIISTNLSINELFVNYDERVISRILGEYKKYKFFGEDIRLKRNVIKKDG